MNLIRRTLDNFAKLLSALLDVHVELKHFRNSKFNTTDDNTVYLLWTLLNKFAQKNNVNIVDNVKLFLHSLNYKSLHFYCLPSDMSEGSRELLLALGFLIHKGILHKYVQDTAYKVPELKMCKIRTSYYNFDTKQEKDEEYMWNAVQWIKGKLRYNQREIEESKMAIKRFVQELNRGVSKAMGNTLNLYELLALGNKTFGKSFACEIEDKILILEYYEKFIRMERLFWDWMNSVRELEKGSSYPPSYEELKRFCDLLNPRKIISKNSKLLLNKQI